MKTQKGKEKLKKKTKNQIPRKQKINRKLKLNILIPETKEKSQQRKSLRFGSKPRKNYKTFIPQSKILRK